MSSPREVGWLDTNVFVHAQTRDASSAACRALLRALDHGEAAGWLDPVVLHELSYVLPRVLRWDRETVAQYLSAVLLAPGVRVEGGNDVLLDAVVRWARTGAAFADAVLAARAAATDQSVCTVNVTDMARLGARAHAPESS